MPKFYSTFQYYLEKGAAFFGALFLAQNRQKAKLPDLYASKSQQTENIKSTLPFYFVIPFNFLVFSYAIFEYAPNKGKKNLSLDEFVHQIYKENEFHLFNVQIVNIRHAVNVYDIHSSKNILSHTQTLFNQEDKK